MRFKSKHLVLTVAALLGVSSVFAFSQDTSKKHPKKPEQLRAAYIARLQETYVPAADEHTVGSLWTGQSALGRLDRDVLAQSNVKYVIVLLGINDIGHTHNAQTPADKVTAGQIIWGLGQIAVRAHSRGLKVYAATLTPYVGAKYQDDDGQAMHEAVNAALRAGKSGFDGVIDFDQVTHDPAHPDVFLPAYDSGDHLHPGDAGYKAMGDAIDLKLFQ